MIDTRYYLRVGGEPERPLTLLRRRPEPGGRISEQVLRRDLRWYPTDLFLNNARNGEWELTEVSAERAAEVLDAWRSAR